MKPVASLLSLLFCLASCNFSPHSNAGGDTKKPTTGDVERISPLQYLQLKSDYMFGNGAELIVDGRITNYATLANYKDVTLQVFCIDAEGKISKREKLVALDRISPGLSMPFKIKTLAPAGTKKVMVKLFDAQGVK